MPPWQSDLPRQVRNMHREVYGALHAKAPCCAMMGARTLVELVLIQVVGSDKGSFRSNLSAAVQTGHLTQNSKKVLESAIDAGSAAAHRGFAPNEQQIADVLDIVEHLLQGTYSLERTSDRLKKVIPPRAP